MIRLLAIDPGPTESAWLNFDNGTIGRFGKSPNSALADFFRFGHKPDHLAIEMIASYGMPVGAEVFNTCVWIGRFIEAAGIPFTLIYRANVKLNLCLNVRAKDSNVRQALIDRYGGQEKAVGRKKQPGVLYGISGDVWSALAVAVTWSDTHAMQEAGA